LIVKNQTVIDCLQLSDSVTRYDEKLTSFLKLVDCIFILWVNTQNLTGWKRWVLYKCDWLTKELVDVRPRSGTDYCNYLSRCCRFSEQRCGWNERTADWYQLVYTSSHIPCRCFPCNDSSASIKWL